MADDITVDEENYNVDLFEYKFEIDNWTNEEEGEIHEVEKDMW